MKNQIIQEGYFFETCGLWKFVNPNVFHMLFPPKVLFWKVFTPRKNRSLWLEFSTLNFWRITVRKVLYPDFISGKQSLRKKKHIQRYDLALLSTKKKTFRKKNIGIMTFQSNDPSNRSISKTKTKLVLRVPAVETVHEGGCSDQYKQTKKGRWN